VQALSAVTGEGMAELVEVITAAMTETTQEAHVHLGFDEGRKRAWLYERGLIEDERQTEDGFDLTVRWSARQQAQFEQV
jgi:GTP-binding protein HflX